MPEKQVKVAEIEQAEFDELDSPLDLAVLVHVELTHDFDDTLDVAAVADYFAERGWAPDRDEVRAALARLADAELLEWLVLPADL
ncbi:hypothetical protein [Allokutzneria albata]|uniref:Uncharacterized protein n=1 Tax=Allokutzneria albata TaxID=211114 RepID=A0A1G9R230_ALLAB|nr:hypothetical protein [Allokutzneria albata]SDM17309.1 hypothetical protein SAMN04489726_0161 [Allokutzneria albata]